ncbi:MAG: hypothetical protein ACD_81C00100G0007 [uncultured bacterium]|uniref:Uncharacterized protein n=1 Tax=Candidatus Wolfebacteria bacterium GW2011_GWE2_44_13 TaxID=1619017 RepID=A0A0G1H843_9BACT|nr:MAG: hypothetical protein ACD_81C00100G0007 [uncultured bacterium]KKT42985.1 MAG: hypothetical protein UW32_C0003G0088 [Candidatus Wolfebacteria bacterium GW2011_GWE2_44_13]
MAIFDELKSAAAVLKEAGKIEQYEQILVVQKELLDQQKHIYDLEIENRALKELLKVRDSLEFRNGAYWKIGEKEEGPFCSRCWDVNSKTVRMRPGANRAFHGCPECKTSTQTDPGYQTLYVNRKPPSSCR